MTPAELLALADAATPGPWEVDASDDALDVRGAEHATATIWIHLAGPMTMGDDAIPEVKARALADARLIALAPDLARLVAEMGEALALVDECADALTEDGYAYLVVDVRVALAKLSELEAR